MTRPDKAQLSQMIRNLEEADKKLSAIASEQEIWKGKVFTAYHALQESAAEEKLRELPVEELNRDKSGIRIQLLRDHGITTVADLSGMTATQLSASIDGIGAESAQKILGKAAQLRESSMRYAKVRLDAGSRNKDMQQVLSALAFLLATKQPAQQAQGLHKESHELITGYLPAVKKLKSSVGWLFSSRIEKEKKLSAYERLDALDSERLYAQAKELASAYEKQKRSYKGNQAAKAFEADAASFYACLEEIIGIRPDEAKTAAGLPEALVKAIDAYPIDLSLMKSTLRHYQLFGTKYILHQRKVLLGDEMGLGKTMQAIAAMAHLMAAKKTHFLVVCPVSVMVNWTREIAKHSQMHAVMIHGSDRGEEYEQWLSDGGIAITTFETITRLSLSEWVTVDMLVVDEAHYVKNPKAQRTIALQKIAAVSEHILFMSGTPMENKVEEMSFLIGMLNEEIAGQIKNMNSLEVAQAFREKVAPVYLRRVREDVLTELPEKIEKEQWCTLGREELAAYRDALADGGYMQVRKVSWNVPDITCSSKATRLMEICEQAKEEGRRIIVFSFFLEVIEKVQALLSGRCFGPITGSVSAAKRQEIIDAFSTAEPGSVLLCQIIAAGTGLNIQAASVVIICEPQWKPSTETQAISRAYRMGQTQTVVVHRLLADETVDERIMDILKGKTELFEGFADESAVGQAGKALLQQAEQQEADPSQGMQMAAESAVTEMGTQDGEQTGMRDVSEAAQQSLMKQIVEEQRRKYDVS